MAYRPKYKHASKFISRRVASRVLIFRVTLDCRLPPEGIRNHIHPNTSFKPELVPFSTLVRCHTMALLTAKSLVDYAAQQSMEHPLLTCDLLILT